MTDAPTTSGLTRRAVLKGTLATTAYVAPAILATSRVTAVAAASPLPCTQPVTLVQDTVIYNAAPNAAYTVLLQPNGTGAFTPFGTITTNAVGFGFLTAPVTFDSSQVHFLRLTAVVPGADPATQPAAPPFDAPLIALTVCPRVGTLQLRAFNVPTTAACAAGGSVTSWQLYIDAALLNASPNTAYDVYAQPNGTGAFQLVTRGTTNGQGNASVIAPLAVTGAAPTSVVVNVVLAGAAASPAAFTASASGGTLITVVCPAPGLTVGTATGLRLVGL